MISAERVDIMQCKYFRKRVKKGNIYFYCTLKKKEVRLNCRCGEIDYKQVKKLKNNTVLSKKTKKLAKLERKRYSIFTNDLDHCIENKDHEGHIDKHECLSGKNRLKSMKYGLVVPLCRKCHQDKSILLKWKLKAQKEFVKKHDYKLFMNIFKIDYIKKYNK